MVHLNNLRLLWLFYLLRIAAIRLRNCAEDRGEIDLEEDTARTTPVVCDQIGSDTAVVWGVYTGPTASVTPQGACHPTTGCPPSLSNIIARTPLNAPNSTITITKLSRDIGGNWDVQCQETTTMNPPTVLSTARCHLNIMYAARQSETSCSLTTSFSHVTGSCRITKVFSSTGSYFCDFIRESTLGMNKTRSSYIREISGSPLYGSGTCQYSAPPPSTPGTYTYTVVVYPGALTITFSGAVVIAEPDASPTIGCNEKHGHVPEYSDLVCSCTARNFGSPVGYLQVQRAGNVLVTNGTEGRNVTFSIQNVTRAHDGEVLTCVLYWVQNRQSAYTLNIAYGPDSVSLSDPGVFDLHPTNPHQLTLTCTASGYKPSVTYRWSGACVNSTSSSCTFTPKSSNNGDAITCTAINTVTNVQRTSSSRILTIRYPPNLPPVIVYPALYSGHAATINCTVFGGNPSVTSVTFSCGSQTQVSAGTSAVILITADSSTDRQRCECSANWENKSPPWYTLTAIVNLTVYSNISTNETRHDVTCGETEMTFDIDLPADVIMPQTVTLSDPRCAVTRGPHRLQGQTALNACGTTVAFLNDSVVFSNEIFLNPDSSGTASGRVIPIHCRYNISADLRLSYLPIVRQVLFTEEGVGQFGFQMQQFQDAQYSVAVDAASYPLRTSSSQEIFVQLSLRDLGLRTSSGRPAYGMDVERCLASPLASVTDARLREHEDLILEGCPASGKVHLHNQRSLNASASGSDYFRFSFHGVTFSRDPVDPTRSFAGLVYVHCHVTLCPLGQCRAGQQPCSSPPAAAPGGVGGLRRRRAASWQSQAAGHQLSTGPLLVLAVDEASATSDNPAVIALSVVAAVACLAVVVVVVAWRRGARPSKGYQLVKVDEQK